MHLDWRPIALDGGPPISTSVTAAETLRLQELAADADVLEVGSAYGYSAVAFALAGAKSVTAVDSRQWVPLGTFEGVLDAYKVRDRVQAVTLPSQNALPWLHSEGKSFDLIFIDGDHTAPAVQSDVIWSQRLIREGGTIAVHDYDEPCCCPDVGPTLKLMLGTPDELVDTMAVYYATGLLTIRGVQRPELFVAASEGMVLPRP